jgi:hypothetical protein
MHSTTKLSFPKYRKAIPGIAAPWRLATSKFLWFAPNYLYLALVRKETVFQGWGQSKKSLKQI